MILYFKVLEPDSLNIVNQDMNEKSIVPKNLPFWYTVDDNEYVLKVSSQNCKCDGNVEFVEDVEYVFEVEFKRYNTKKSNGYTCVLHNIIDDNTPQYQWLENIYYLNISNNMDIEYWYVRKMTCCCGYCAYVKAHTDIFKNKKLIKRVHNTITKNPNENINYEELYFSYYNTINMKAKQHRDSKKNDEEYMKKIRHQKLAWYYENQQQVNDNRKLKRDNNKMPCSQQWMNR